MVRSATLPQLERRLHSRSAILSRGRTNPHHRATPNAQHARVAAFHTPPTEAACATADRLLSWQHPGESDSNHGTCQVTIASATWKHTPNLSPRSCQMARHPLEPPRGARRGGGGTPKSSEHPEERGVGRRLGAGSRHTDGVQECLAGHLDRVVSLRSGVPRPMLRQHAKSGCPGHPAGPRLVVQKGQREPQTPFISGTESGTRAPRLWLLRGHTTG